MAPQAPKKRTTARARVSKASAATSKPSPAVSGFASAFGATKEDKRRIKHSSLISRIEKANLKDKKRRRPSKKLVATLASLADALPDATEAEHEDAVSGAKIRHASLKSRPGAMKRKQKLEGMERERFDRNMAQMSGQSDQAATDAGNGSSNTAARWASLRGFIASSMISNAEKVK